MRVSIQDKYELESGQIYITGTQALVRLPLLQRARDTAAGLNTAGFITGYRGSPLGGYDIELARQKSLLENAQIRFQPAVNEDLAATALWGTQQVPLFDGAKYDGVFGIWYGKGPGVDRSGDPIKHANRQGTSPHGGVLAVFGDDHAGKSSTISHQSEQAMAAAGVPVLYPANIQEVLDFGLAGIAMSRFAGVWIGLKCVNEVAEATATVFVDTTRSSLVDPDHDFAGVDVHSQFVFDPLGEETRLTRHKLPAAMAFARANSIDKVILESKAPRIGIVCSGKSSLQVPEALELLGLSLSGAADLGIGIYKVGMIWPLEPQSLREFAKGYDELLFVEEKRSFVQAQAESVLFNLPAEERPLITGKCDDEGVRLLAEDAPLGTVDIARAIGMRLCANGITASEIQTHLDQLDSIARRCADAGAGSVPRVPYFCAGCPHNRSTRVPEGSRAMSGIGCHTMALWMDRNTTPPTQMGGEGANWIGIAPFSETKHIFQNLGDGTYFHSGLLAIRAAVEAQVNITYKILYNDAVAMTGGQPVEGQLSPIEMARQVSAERVRKVAIVSDNPRKYTGDLRPEPGVKVYHRDELLGLEEQFRDTEGTTVIIYEQTCAAEKRRRRKRGKYPDPPRRIFINSRVCEGCGDCSIQSNCVAIAPLETDLGRKRRIDQSSCNKDYSCVNGFCPSFVTIHGGQLRQPQSTDLDKEQVAKLPLPAAATIEGVHSTMVTGIGGTGVVTIGAILGMAAHIEGKSASVFDNTGLAQKNGAVVSHLRIAAERDRNIAAAIESGQSNLILGCDLLVSASPAVSKTVTNGTTSIVLNTHLTATGQFQLDPDIDFESAAALRGLHAAVGEDRCHHLDANKNALRVLGDSIGTNMLLVGYALQKGLLPLSLSAIEQAIELNGVKVDFNKRALTVGRLLAHDPESLAPQLQQTRPAGSAPKTLEEVVDHRSRLLAQYQDERYAQRYRKLVDRVATAEHRNLSGQSDLAMAVAASYYKLLAYKDEYEVARLYTDGQFLEAVAREFEGDYRVSYHLAPPILARRDKATGYLRKREFGRWLYPFFALLACMKRLRGTPFDIFSYTEERRTERELIEWYENSIEEVVESLDSSNADVAVLIASIPEQIRGYGHVKEQSIASARHLMRELQRRFRTSLSEAA